MKRLFLFLLLLCAAHTACFADKFSFAVFGDNRDGDEVFMDLVRNMNSDSSLQFAVNTGDMTSKGSKGEYDNYWSMAGESKARIYDTMGNHDLGFMGIGEGIFRKKYVSTYYYFDHGDSRFIIIDNSKSKGLGRKQWAWLEKALDTDKYIFVFMHKPLFDVTGMYPGHVMDSKTESKKLDELLVKFRVKYVFAGHIHGYGRQAINGITYIITAGGGAPLYMPAFSGGYYHYVKVIVDDGKISDKVVKVFND